MMLNRRKLISSVAVLALIPGCAGLTASQVTAQVTQDVATIANGLAATLPAIGAAIGITPQTVATVGQAIADIQKVAAAVGSAATNAAAQPLVQQIETDLNSIVGVLASVPGLPAAVTLALQAAAVLLPVIEAAIGMVIAPTPAPAPATAKLRAKAAATLTPDQARLILIGLAGK